jgi:hypothetical protein
VLQPQPGQVFRSLEIGFVEGVQRLLLLFGHRAVQVGQLLDRRVIFQPVDQPAHAGQDRVGLRRAHRLQRT